MSDHILHCHHGDSARLHARLCSGTVCQVETHSGLADVSTAYSRRNRYSQRVNSKRMRRAYRQFSIHVQNTSAENVQVHTEVRRTGLVGHILFHSIFIWRVCALPTSHQPPEPYGALVELPPVSSCRAPQIVLHNADCVLFAPDIHSQRRGSQKGPRANDDTPCHHSFSLSCKLLY